MHVHSIGYDDRGRSDAAHSECVLEQVVASIPAWYKDLSALVWTASGVCYEWRAYVYLLHAGCYALV